jgi:integrator complex subunit 11
MIEVFPLGGGQDVGKSCILVSAKGKTVMLDCGIHMGFSDGRRFPDFSLISKSGDFTERISCVLITHFHLDHVGALPLFTEIKGYNGPVYMTYPTKAIAPILLEDFRKISTSCRDSSAFFSSADVARCMRRVRCIRLHEIVRVDEDITIVVSFF